MTKDQADAADFLRACAHASAYQLAGGSSTLQRAREERETRSARKLAFPTSGATVNFAVTGDEQLASAFLESPTDVFPKESTVLRAIGRLRVSFLQGSDVQTCLTRKGTQKRLCSSKRHVTDTRIHRLPVEVDRGQFVWVGSLFQVNFLE